MKQRADRNVLTEQEGKFLEAYWQTGNKAEAYRRAFDPFVSSVTASKRGQALAEHPLIVEGMKYMREQVVERTGVTASDVLLRFLDIADADPDELIGLRVGCCRYCYGDGGGYQWRQREYMEAVAKAEKNDDPLPDIAGGFGYDHTAAPNHDCEECRGEGIERVVARDTSKLSPGAKLLYGGVKQTKNGIEIIMADRVKARESVARIIGAFDDKLRLSGAVAGMTAVVKLEATDPVEAAREYQKLIKNIA
jgi:phage terminase small subunit